jgi:hypothetical protein
MLKGENKPFLPNLERAEHPIAEHQIVPQCFYETVVLPVAETGDIFRNKDRVSCVYAKPKAKIPRSSPLSEHVSADYWYRGDGLITFLGDSLKIQQHCRID